MNCDTIVAHINTKRKANTMEKKYRVIGNGHIYGIYTASSAQEACDFCAQDEGYLDSADMVDHIKHLRYLVAVENKNIMIDNIQTLGERK